jgi:hypothetical protein
MDQMRPIYIVLRQSPDWSKQTYADLEKTRDFCRIIGRPETYMIDRVLLWDRTFRTGFFAARQFMKEISQESFRSVTGATVVPLAEVRSVLDRRAFFLFTDDDDWYHPEIARVVAKLDPRACDAVLWRSAELGIINGLDLQEADTFYTNAYAVSGEVLLQRPGNLDRVTQHFEAMATFVRKSYGSVLRRIGYASLYRRLTVRGFQSIVRLPDSLSVTNKHPATVSAMSNLEDLTQDRLIEFIRARWEANRNIVVPDAFSWAKGMIDRVNDFMDHLLRTVR